MSTNRSAHLQALLAAQLGSDGERKANTVPNMANHYGSGVQVKSACILLAFCQLSAIWYLCYLAEKHLVHSACGREHPAFNWQGCGVTGSFVEAPSGQPCCWQATAAQGSRCQFPQSACTFFFYILCGPTPQRRLRGIRDAQVR